MANAGWPVYADTPANSPAPRWPDYAESEVDGLCRSLTHASHPVGWPVDEGRAYIRELVSHATQPEFVYSHAWSTDELVMWDDRWTMHRATPYDAPHPRKLRWCGAVELEPV